jgi:response regulator RpfG family c-di-GMP phosphodiesterase
MENDNIEILIIDDNEENRMILEVICKSLGFKPQLAVNGKNALTILEKYTPSLVLCDLIMPELNGFEFLKKFKLNPKWKSIPIIMVSSVDETESILKCLQQGADDYITKPFEPDILKARVDNLLSKYLYMKMEKELLEKTFSGSLKVLSDILSTLSPFLFGKSTRTRRIAKQIAEEVNYPNLWEIEVSAMFYLIGCITLPPDTITKLIEGRTLIALEKIMYDNHPYIGYKLLNNIPRLENVSHIVFFQNKMRFNNQIPQEIQNKVENVPLGAKILHLAIEYEYISSKTTLNSDIISYLRKIETDAELLSAIEKIVVIDSGKELKKLKLSELQSGMIFASDIITINNNKVANRWMEVTSTLLDVMKLIHSKVAIQEPIDVFVSKK